MPFFWIRIVIKGQDYPIIKNLRSDFKIQKLKDIIENDTQYEIGNKEYFFITTKSTKLTDMNKTFHEYGVKNRPARVPHMITVVLDATGGTSASFPKDVETKKTKCIISLEEENCVEMDCGHYISYDNLCGHLTFTKNKDGCSKIECPLSNCKEVWDYECSLYLANFGDKKKQIYENIFKERYSSQDLSECPKCKTANLRDRKKVRIYRLVCGECKLHFCDLCKQKWLKSGLVLCGNQTCETYDIQRALNESPWLPQKKNTYTAQYPANSIPSIRACPSCWSIIHHKVGCLRMPCPKCKHQFCYVCLKPWNGHGYNNQNCFNTKPAPKQQLP